MAKAVEKKRKSRTLVLGYLENISSKIFSEYPKGLTDLVGKSHGIYALYKSSRLYYIGLASNLRGRIKQHLKDKHAGKWDKFSLYLIRKADHIRELESLIMRVVTPKGNIGKGRLAKADNLKSLLDDNIKAEQSGQRKRLLGSRLQRESSKCIRSRAKKHPSRGKPTLAPFIKKGFSIQGTYKGKLFKAVVYRSGSIKFNGALYNTPSTAGNAARRRSTNGWYFWQFKNKKGEWVKLDLLRKK